MTDHATPMFEDMDDLELVTMYLNGHLDAARAEAVRRRLEEDPAFLEFAEPMILTWSVLSQPQPPPPRPEGEVERDWAEFVRRTGFPERRLPGPRLQPWFVRILALVILAVLIAGYAWRAPVRAYLERRDYGPPLPYDSAWVTIGDGIQVQLQPGASLRLRPAPSAGRQQVFLEGTARFYVEARDGADHAAPPGRFRVQTRVGHVTSAGYGFFTVSAHPDTTWVTLHYFPAPRPNPTGPTQLMIATESGLSGETTMLSAGERGRMVRGGVPERIRSR